MITQIRDNHPRPMNIDGRRIPGLLPYSHRTAVVTVTQEVTQEASGSQSSLPDAKEEFTVGASKLLKHRGDAGDVVVRGANEAENTFHRVLPAVTVGTGYGWYSSSNNIHILSISFDINIHVSAIVILV